MRALHVMLAVAVMIAAGCASRPEAVSSCTLMENPETRTVDCFGCSGGVCKTAPAGWVVVSESEDEQCTASSGGCKLR